MINNMEHASTKIKDFFQNTKKDNRIGKYCIMYMQFKVLSNKETEI